MGGNMGEPSNTRGNVDKTMGFNGFNGIEWHLGEMGYCKTIYKAVLFRFHFKCLSCSVLMSTPRAQETKP